MVEPQETLLAYVDMVDACAPRPLSCPLPFSIAFASPRKTPATNRSFEDSLGQCGGNMQSRAMIDVVVKLQVRHSQAAARYGCSAAAGTKTQPS